MQEKVKMWKKYNKQYLQREGLLTLKKKTENRIMKGSWLLWSMIYTKLTNRRLKFFILKSYNYWSKEWELAI